MISIPFYTLATATSWVQQAIELQWQLNGSVTIDHGPELLGTHNSAISSYYSTPTSYWADPNQYLSLPQQLDQGVRAIELDVFYTLGAYGKNELLISHGIPVGGHGCVGCSVDDRPFSTALAEIRTWLKQPRHQHDVIMLYLNDRLGSDPETYNLAAAEIAEHLGDLVYQPGVYQPGQCLPLPPSLNWNTVLKAGKQVVIIADTHCKTQAWSQYIFASSYPTSHTDFEPWPACTFRGYSTAAIHSQLFRSQEDRTWITKYFDPPAPSHITEERMKQLTNCGIPLIAIDKMQQNSPRLQASIWSWAPGEPGLQQGCAVQSAGGRFRTEPCTQIHRFACSNGSNWKVTPIKAPWSYGQERCQQLGGGYTFQVPKNGYQNLQLKAAATTYRDKVWLNYHYDHQASQWITVPLPETPKRPHRPGYRQLRNLYGAFILSGYCLEAKLENSRSATAIPVISASCTATKDQQSSQHWYQDRAGYIYNQQAQGYCLTATANKKAADVNLEPCQGLANQRWQWGDNNSLYSNDNPELVLDQQDPLLGPGKSAHLWDFKNGCHSASCNSRSQLWTLY